MPRRLIIGILVVLIVGIVGGTVALVVQRLRRDETTTPTASPGTLNPADRGSQQIADPTGDSDGDGLSNADESLWGTLPGNADTDGDGFKDGEEVTANHNPTIAAPGDTLPPNFEPGQNVQPLAAAPNAAIAVDQFFQDNLDLTGGTNNLTDEYRSQYKEEDRTPDTLAAFAQTKPIITSLPTPTDKATLLQAADTPLVMGEYLDVAGNMSVFSQASIIAEAINNLFEGGSTSLVEGLALSARLHQEKLIQLRVPPSAVTLHKLLLGYTELLAATYDQLARYNEDPVRAVVALNQLEEIDRKYYPLIEQEADRLHTLQEAL